MEKCPKMAIPCPNHYDMDNILREDVDEHRKVCSLEIISCKYIKLGCGTRMARQEVEKHEKEKTEEHLYLATGRLEKLENTVSRLENVISRMLWPSYLQSKVASQSQIAPVFIKISTVTKKINERTRWKSPCFYTENEGYKMHVLLTFTNSHIAVYMLLGRNENDELNWPFRGGFDVAILNQINDTEHYSRRIVYSDHCSNDVAGKGATRLLGFPEFISYDNLCTSSTHRYIKDDSVYIKVSYCRPET